MHILKILKIKVSVVQHLVKLKKKPESFDHVKSDSCPKDVTRMLEFNCRDLQENKKINIHRLSLARLNWLLFLRSNNHHPHLDSQNGWGWKGPLKIVSFIIRHFSENC